MNPLTLFLMNYEPIDSYVDWMLFQNYSLIGPYHNKKWKTHTHTLVLFMSYRGYRTLTVEPKKHNHFSFPPQIYLLLLFRWRRKRRRLLHCTLSSLSLSLSVYFPLRPFLSHSSFFCASLSLSTNRKNDVVVSLRKKAQKETLIIIHHPRVDDSLILRLYFFVLRNVEKVSILGAQSLSPSLLRSFVFVFNFTRRLRLWPWLRSPRPRSLQLVRVQCLSLQT